MYIENGLVKLWFIIASSNLYLKISLKVVLNT